jgi:hypothetical protein
MLKKVVPAQGFKLYLEMEDGRCGFFDVEPLLKSKFYLSLKDPNYFKQVKIVLGALTWPGVIATICNHKEVGGRKSEVRHCIQRR